MSKMKLLVNKIYSSMSMYKYADTLGYPYFFFLFHFPSLRSICITDTNHPQMRNTICPLTTHKNSRLKKKPPYYGLQRENIHNTYKLYRRIYINIRQNRIYCFTPPLESRTPQLQICIEVQVHLISLSPSSTPQNVVMSSSSTRHHNFSPSLIAVRVARGLRWIDFAFNCN